MIEFRSLTFHLALILKIHILYSYSSEEALEEIRYSVTLNNSEDGKSNEFQTRLWKDSNVAEINVFFAIFTYMG